jgi:hypothetical protein
VPCRQQTSCGHPPQPLAEQPDFSEWRHGDGGESDRFLPTPCLNSNQRDSPCHNPVPSAATLSEPPLMVLLSRALRNIAERFGTTATSLHRHRQHLPAYLALAKDAKEMVNASGLLDRVEFLIDRLEGIARTPRTNELGRPPLPPFGKSAAAWCC